MFRLRVWFQAISGLGWSEAKSNLFFATYILPIIVKVSEDQDELPAVRERISFLFTEQRKGNLWHILTGVYHKFMPGVSGGVVPCNSYSGVGIVLFLLAIRDEMKQLDSEEFESAIKILYAHEVIHLEQELNGLIPLLDTMRGTLPKEAIVENIVAAEVDAWAKTITEVIRPMLQQGKKIPSSESKISEIFSKFNDDPNHPGWIDYIRRHYSAAHLIA